MRLAEPKILNERTVTYVFGVRPSDDAEYGIYLGYQGDKEIRYKGVGAERILINFCAFLILQHLIPGLKAHVFYELVIVPGRKWWDPFPNVDYGPVQLAQETSMQWGKIADFDPDSDIEEDTEDEEDLELQKRWLKLLTQNNKSDKEIIEDAWMGKGNMWVFKHPGVFPIAEVARLAGARPPIRLSAFDGGSAGRFEVLKTVPLLTLPPELMETIIGYLPPESMLCFISTSRAIHARFCTRLNRLTYIWIRRERPWYLPVGPIECEEGNTEIVRWRDDWQKANGRDGGEEEIPWFEYHLACKKSPNVRSRERIWKIILQIKEILAASSLSTISAT